MKIIEKSQMPNGTEIQIEEWNNGIYDYMIGAYPVAKNTGRYGWVRRGNRFRLSIKMDTYDEASLNFEALKNGAKRLEDLADHFWSGIENMFLLGMNAEYD